MAKTKPSTEAIDVQGRALVDLPAFSLKSGEYASLPAEIADQLEAIGAFDTKARQ